MPVRTDSKSETLFYAVPKAFSHRRAGLTAMGLIDVANSTKSFIRDRSSGIDD